MHGETDETFNPKVAIVEKRIPCEVYSRVCGYIRPTMDWNAGKKQEFADREYYRIPEEARNGRTP